MGLFDFFKKGKEEPAKRPASPGGNVNRPTGTTTGGIGTTPGHATQRDYTIQPGDSLSKIAKKHYGNASEWQKIYQANKDKIKDPNMIYPGQKIIIP